MIARTVSDAEGITKRHSRGCRSHEGRRCNCAPHYQANVWDRREHKLVRKTFESEAEAKNWRADARGEMRDGTYTTPTRDTFRRVAEQWRAEAEAGVARNSSGQPYKPSTLRGHRTSLDKRLLPEFGAHPLGDVTPVAVQKYIDRLGSEGLSGSTICNTIQTLGVVYRWAKRRGLARTNPAHDLELPASDGRRDRVVPPEDAAELVAAAPAGDRAIWATAFYAGLRVGEIQALDWSHIDLDGNVLRVERSWDQGGSDTPAQFVDPKSKAGERTVPIVSLLRGELLRHRMRCGRPTTGLVFPGGASRPFYPATIQRRADRAWKDAELSRVTCHEARHTFASYSIAAGVNAKTLCTYMGHGSIQITYDRYGHLMPGNEREAASQLDAFLGVDTDTETG